MPCQVQRVPNRLLNGSTVFGLVWECAWEAVIRAFLVLLLGGIALGIVGDIFYEMIPSAPPGLGKPPLEADSPNRSRADHQLGTQWALLKQHQFLIVAGIFFVAGLWKRVRFVEAPSLPVSTRREKVVRRFPENWFGLIVGNAFGAMISAIIVVWLQQFSFSQMVWHWLVENVFVHLLPAANSIMGRPRVDFFGRLWDWYGENQLKFTFWFLYFAAIGDDLGLPNFKTIGRFVWRRWRKRTTA